LEEIARTLEGVRQGTTAVRAIQVLSRSGVGKSSLLLKTPTALDAPFVTVDGRSLRTAADVRLVVSEAVLRVHAALETSDAIEPRSLEETADALEALGAMLRKASSVLAIQIDQF